MMFNSYIIFIIFIDNNYYNAAKSEQMSTSQSSPKILTSLQEEKHVNTQVEEAVTVEALNNEDKEEYKEEFEDNDGYEEENYEEENDNYEEEFED